MDDNLKKIRDLCKNIKFTGNTTDEYLFTVNCVDYFFYSKNIGEVDIRDGFTDGANDGGIDFVYDDGEKMYLIQGKSQSNLTYDDISDLYSKILETVNNFKSGDTNQYNDNLKSIYKNTLDKLNNPEIEFVLFTNTYLDKSMVNKIDKLSRNGEFENYNLIAYGKEELDNKQLSIDGGNMCVEEGVLELDSTQCLEYANGIGTIFSIKAYSLKDLYDKKKNDGLFGYNLREQISQATVDNQIDETIKDQKDRFWFYNNGITIGCSDYYKDGNKLKLYNFSIINGAQTTSKIGKSSLITKDYDFSLVCKVIKSENSLDDEFIRKISEASNSQKPIKFRDLKSNSPEQQTLQQRFINNGKYQLAVEIKRGVRPNNYRFVDSWKRVTNEYVGQIIMATQFQKPGTARSNKAEIFSNKEVYNSIFSIDRVRNYDYNSLYDFVQLAHLYDNFRVAFEEKTKNDIDKSNDESYKKELNGMISICQNAKFVIISLVAYFIKRMYFGVKNIEDKNFSEPIIKGDLSLNYEKDDYLDNINALFEFMVDRLSMIYRSYETQLKLTSISNFFKTDNNYCSYIVPSFEKMLNNKYDKDNIMCGIIMFDDNNNKKA